MYSSIGGIIPGLVWGRALGLTVSEGFWIGVLGGIVVGILLWLFGRAALIGGNLVQSEIAVACTSMLLLFYAVVTALGLVVWLIRLLVN